MSERAVVSCKEESEVEEDKITARSRRRILFKRPRVVAAPWGRWRSRRIHGHDEDDAAMGAEKKQCHPRQLAVERPVRGSVLTDSVSRARCTHTQQPHSRRSLADITQKRHAAQLVV